MTVGVLKEPSTDSRVSLLPEAVQQLVKGGNTVYVEKGAGQLAFASNEAYLQAGALIKDRNEILNSSQLALCINYILPEYPVPEGLVFLGMYQPLVHPERVKHWIERKLTVFSLDMLPRTTRAQSMDVLSSQANIAGYKAVLLAANIYSRYFPMFMTAAGSIAPAKVLVIGAGVAGLQAVATSRRLGAVVEVFDTRPAVKEEVMSLGARFIEIEGAADASKAGGYAVEQSEAYLEKQKARIAESIAKSDIVITTAQIPGKKAPLLVTGDMIQNMKNGSVIIDLAAATGGNTPYTKDNETVNVNGISIIGASNLPSSMPSDASKLYGKNILNFLKLISKSGEMNLNFNDDLVKGACITHQGVITNERLQSLQ